MSLDHAKARPAPNWPLMVAVFAVAMAVLGFEVSLTRAFSVLLRFHYVFLAISIASCGLGIGGLADFLLRRGPLRQTAAETVLVATGSAAAVLFPVAIYLLFATPLSAHLTSVWVVTAVCLPPFLAAGAFLSHAFAWRSAQSGTLYFADLIGASLGSFLVIGLLQLLGGINAALVWGPAVGAGTAVFALASGRRAGALAPALATVAVLSLVLANRGGAIIDLPVMPLVDDPNAKPLYQELGDPSVGAKIVDTEWNAFARTDVVTNAGQDDLFVYTDGEVPTNMIPFDGDLQAILPRLQEFIGFYAFYETRPEKVLLIGPGGGLDILLALAVDARQIDGAELNPSIPRIVRKYGEFTGHVYDMPGVDIRVDEGRSFVSRSDERYDLIYMALTKTATTASSSLALVESYIHTEEAFSEFVGHLTDDGCLAFVCQSPLILMRTMLTAATAIERAGTPRPQSMNHICMLSVPRSMMGMGPYRYLLLAFRSPLPQSRARGLVTDCIAMGYEPIFFPGVFEPAPFTALTQGGMDNAGFVAWWNQWRGADARSRVDFSPCPDDRPFVVDMSVGIPPQFSRFLLVAVGLVIALTVCVVLSVGTAPSESSPGVTRIAGAALYFCLLGSGFMLVEVVLIQRLVLYLGYPVLTLSVILFSLLLGGGLGSLWSQTWPMGRGLSLRAGCAALAVVGGALAIYTVHPLVVAATLAWPIQYRCAMTMALLLPIGFVMGTVFPTGIRVVGAWSTDLVPWMWGLNGVTSVVGSVGAMALAKLWGFGSVLVVGMVVYAAAAGVGLAHHFSREPGSTDGEHA